MVVLVVRTMQAANAACGFLGGCFRLVLVLLLVLLLLLRAAASPLTACLCGKE